MKPTQLDAFHIRAQPSHSNNVTFDLASTGGLPTTRHGVTTTIGSTATSDVVVHDIKKDEADERFGADNDSTDTPATRSKYEDEEDFEIAPGLHPQQRRGNDGDVLYIGKEKPT
jgi:hypothetical protein